MRSPARTWVGAMVFVLGVVVGLVVAVTADLPNVATMRTWLDEGGFERWLAVALVVAAAFLTPISRTALTLLLGAVAGFPAGLGLALSGGLLGGLGAFALSHWLGREAVLRLSGSRLTRVDRLLRERGFVAVLTARVLPVAPFTLVSYSAGLSGVRLGPYALGTAVGLLPWSIVYVGVGASVTRFSSWTTLLDIALPIVAVFTVALLGHPLVAATVVTDGRRGLIP